MIIRKQTRQVLARSAFTLMEMLVVVASIKARGRGDERPIEGGEPRGSS